LFNCDHRPLLYAVVAPGSNHYQFDEDIKPWVILYHREQVVACTIGSQRDCRGKEKGQEKWKSYIFGRHDKQLYKKRHSKVQLTGNLRNPAAECSNQGETCESLSCAHGGYWKEEKVRGIAIEEANKR